MTVVCPRGAIAASVAGAARGRVEGTTLTWMRPGVPGAASSRTLSVTPVVAPRGVLAGTLTRRRCPTRTASRPGVGPSMMSYASSSMSSGYG